MPARNLYSILRATAEKYGGATALYQPDGSGYRTWTWQEYRRGAEEVAAGLRTLGIVKGDVVALAAESRAEFYLCDLGIMTAGGIAASLYTVYPAAELVRTIKACGAEVLIADTPAMLDRLTGVPGFPSHVRCVVMTGKNELAITLDELRARGRQTLDADHDLLRRLAAEVRGEDTAILYLTSGATGEPKMALVSHDSIVSNLELAPYALNLSPADRMLSFLPSGHITQRLVVELLPLDAGVPVWFSESLMKLPQEIVRVKPTVFVAPPRLWQRMHASIRAELRKRPAWVQRWFERSVALGLRAFRRERLSRVEKLRLALADRVLFRKVRARLGGKMEVCASGSAPLGKELAEFFLAIGLPLIEGYGLTEGGVIILDPPGQMRPGSIGKPLPTVELKLAEDGELLVRSKTLFSGYHKDKRATAEVLRGGWLHTGDVAEIDPDGYVYITGRKKELIVLSSGKKIFPARIELLFRPEPAVSHVLLIGDNRPSLTALITAAEGADAGAVKEAVRRVNGRLAGFEQIRNFEVLERDFSVEAGELTATLKVRRARALERYRDKVERLYPRGE